MSALKKLKERLSGVDRDQEQTYDIDGREYVINGNVFPSHFFPSTGVYTRSIRYLNGRSFWEVGCGAGVTAITAAHSGCNPVVASDISEHAVRNTEQNIARHGLESIVSARLGDLFDVLRPGEKFDVIFWNSNYILVDDDELGEDEYYRLFCDPGYKTHDRFFAGAKSFLEPDGYIILGFSALGDDAQLSTILDRYGYDRLQLDEQSGIIPASDETGQQTHSYKLLQIRPS